MLLRAVLQAGHSMFDAMTHASDLKVRLVRQEMFEYTFWVDLFLVDTLFSLYVPAADYRFLAVDPWISVPTTCWYKVQGLQFLQFTGTLNLMWSKHMNRNCDWWCSLWILPSKNPGFNSNNIKKNGIWMVFACFTMKKTHGELFPRRISQPPTYSLHTEPWPWRVGVLSHFV